MEPLGPADPTWIASYRLIARLGTGGMGQMFLARSPGGHPVAIKVIRPDLADDPISRERFVREVTAARAVNGVFTAPVLDADVDGDPAWVATDYVPGVPLEVAVDRFGRLPETAAVMLARGLAEALAAVHATGLVHRDVRPSNIVISADGPKLIGHGIARLTAGAWSRTRAGTVIGSPAFVSPEQITGAVVGPPADVFALASVVVFSLTGQPPFGSDDPAAVLFRVVHEEPRLAGVPPPLVGILTACLAKSPDRRPTPQMVMDMLDAAVADHPENPDADRRWQLPAALSDEIVRRSAAPFEPATGGDPRPATGSLAALDAPALDHLPGTSRRPPPGPGYGLGIDLGTTWTAAAVWRDGTAAVVALGDRSDSIPSVVHLGDDGVVLVGDPANRRGTAEADRVVREFSRRFADPVPFLVGDREITADRLAGHLLRWVVQTVTAREGGPPTHVTLTFPATWRAYRKELLVSVAEATGLRGVGLLAEPVAAAAYYASTQRLATGDLLAVYDLGGGTFDAAVVRKTTDGFALQGQPSGDDNLGGVDFDETIMEYIAESLRELWPTTDMLDPVTLIALAQIREHVTAAKEALSTDVEATVPVILPGLARQVRMTRTEFESAVHAPVLRTVGLLADTIRSVGAAPTDVSAVLLTGGSSRIPLVSQLIASELGVPVALDAHPKYATCLGAAIAAGARIGPSRRGPSPGPVERRAGTGVAEISVDLVQTGILTRIDTTGPRPSPADLDPVLPHHTGSASTSLDPAPPQEEPAIAFDDRDGMPGRPPPPSPVVPAPRARRGRRVVAVVVAGLVAVATATYLAVHAAGPGPAGVVTATIGVDAKPVGLTEGGGFVWAAEDTGRVIRIDPRTGTSTPIDVGGAPRDVAFAGGTVWVWNYARGVTPIDAASGAPGLTVVLADGLAISGIAAGADFIWLSDSDNDTVSRISTATRRVVGGPIAVGPRPVYMSAGRDRLYVVNLGDHTLTCLDLRTGTVLGTPLALREGSAGVQVFEGVVYVGSPGVVTAVDEQSNTVGDTVPIEGGGQFQAGGGSLWVSYPLRNEVRRFTLATLAAQGDPIEGVGRGATQTLFAFGSLWIADGAGDTVVRIQPG